MLSIGRRPFTATQKGNWIRLILPDGREAYVGLETETRGGEQCCRALVVAPLDVRIERTERIERREGDTCQV